jgi:hypothetical protein
VGGRAAEDRHELLLSLDAKEMAILQQAARSQGSDDVASWARQVLLEAAEARSVEPSPKKKPSTSRPKCGCGGTASPKGECDLSCIMRY